MAGVGTRKLLENENISVWELVLEPGQETGLHTHEHDYVFHVIEPSTLEATDVDGKLIGHLEAEPGHTVFLRVDGDELVSGERRLPSTHSAKNVGRKRYREVLVEIK